MKWIPAIYWFILGPLARRWGLFWLGISVGLSLLTLPLMIIQMQTLFGFGARPIRLDYLVYLWAFVPWFYRRNDPPALLHPAGRQRALSGVRNRLAGVTSRGAQPPT